MAAYHDAKSTFRLPPPANHASLCDNPFGFPVSAHCSAPLKAPACERFTMAEVDVTLRSQPYLALLMDLLLDHVDTSEGRMGMMPATLMIYTDAAQARHYSNLQYTLLRGRANAQQHRSMLRPEACVPVSHIGAYGATQPELAVARARPAAVSDDHLTQCQESSSGEQRAQQARDFVRSYLLPLSPSLQQDERFVNGLWKSLVYYSGEAQSDLQASMQEAVLKLTYQVQYTVCFLQMPTVIRNHFLKANAARLRPEHRIYPSQEDLARPYYSRAYREAVQSRADQTIWTRHPAAAGVPAELSLGWSQAQQRVPCWVVHVAFIQQLWKRIYPNLSMFSNEMGCETLLKSVSWRCRDKKQDERKFGMHLHQAMSGFGSFSLYVDKEWWVCISAPFVHACQFWLYPHRQNLDSLLRHYVYQTPTFRPTPGVVNTQNTQNPSAAQLMRRRRWSKVATREEAESGQRVSYLDRTANSCLVHQGWPMPVYGCPWHEELLRWLHGAVDCRPWQYPSTPVPVVSGTQPSWQAVMSTSTCRYERKGALVYRHYALEPSVLVPLVSAYDFKRFIGCLQQFNESQRGLNRGMPRQTYSADERRLLRSNLKRKRRRVNAWLRTASTVCTVDLRCPSRKKHKVFDESHSVRPSRYTSIISKLHAAVQDMHNQDPLSVWTATQASTTQSTKRSTHSATPPVSLLPLPPLPANTGTEDVFAVACRQGTRKARIDTGSLCIADDTLPASTNCAPSLHWCTTSSSELSLPTILD